MYPDAMNEGRQDDWEVEISRRTKWCVFNVRDLVEGYAH